MLANFAFAVGLYKKGAYLKFTFELKKVSKTFGGFKKMS
jgi:hypothetical protein